MTYKIEIYCRDCEKKSSSYFPHRVSDKDALEKCPNCNSRNAHITKRQEEN